MVENKMEGGYARRKDDREWIEEKKLELRLGPPDDGEWNQIDKFACFSTSISGNKRAFRDTSKDHHHVFSSPNNHQSMILHLQNPSSCLNLKESSHIHNCVDLQSAVEKKKVFSPPLPPPPPPPAAIANTAVSNANSAQKRSGPPPVVGWPPVRSFRKNLGSISNLNPNNGGLSNKICNEKGLFVKINMDGVPIGRKVDLKVYDSYEKLSSAVDDLFRGLLAAQGDNSSEREKVISGVLDGSGEYALVYEDHEGDRMLVGDVPWQMFISTVKRLRVLKTAEISSLCKGSKTKVVHS